MPSFKDLMEADANFPLANLDAMPDVRAKQRIKDIIPSLEQALATKRVPNTLLKKYKSDLNLLIDAAWKKEISEPYVYALGSEHGVPEKLYDLLDKIIFSASQLPGIKKKYDKLKGENTNHPSYHALGNFLNEVMPLVDYQYELTNHVVKMTDERAKKKKEKEAYQQKLVSHDNVQKVIALLREKTEPMIPQITQTYVDSYEGMVAKFQAEGITTYREFREYAERRPYSAYLLQQLLKQQQGKLLLVPEYKQKIKKLAEQVAKSMVEEFINKSTGKLAYILNQKELTNLSVGDIRYDIRSIETWIKAEFEDGSSFRMDLSVVGAYSFHGKPFYRYPATFHDVILPDGTKMRNPSIEKMETEF